jgi:hypothetical protein
MSPQASTDPANREIAEHSTANESWSPFDEPPPILDVQSPILVPTPDIEPGKRSVPEAIVLLGEDNIPCENMPIIQYPDGIIRYNSVAECSNECKADCLQL